MIVRLLLVLSVLLAGCSVFDAVSDCRNICTRYRDCFDANYGVQSCEERCRDNANADKDYYRKVDNCDACIGNKTCSTSFTCGAACIGVVP